MSRVNWKIVKFFRACGDVSVRSRSNWNLEVLVFKKRRNWRTRGKSSRSSKGENQKQTQPTYGVDAGIWCSHHCATLAPPFKFNRNSFLIDTLRFSVDIWTKMIVVILNRVNPPVETTCHMRLGHHYTKTIFFSYQNIIVEFSR